MTGRVLDVRDADAVEALAAELRERYGGVHIVVSNAVAPLAPDRFSDYRGARPPRDAAEPVLDLLVAPEVDPEQYGELIRYGTVLPWHGGTPPVEQEKIVIPLTGAGLTGPPPARPTPPGPPTDRTARTHPDPPTDRIPGLPSPECLRTPGRATSRATRPCAAYITGNRAAAYTDKKGDPLSVPRHRTDPSPSEHRRSDINSTERTC